MYSELTGSVPKLPVNYAKTLVNRSWEEIRRMNLWSFQLAEANWVSPAVINAGTVTTTIGGNTVVFDATASAAISPIITSGPFPTPLTQRQFRVGISTIYNIWSAAVDPISSLVTLTLDRPYTDPSLTGEAYSIFQCYYPAPVQDFRTWINVRDIVNFNDLVLDKTREWVDQRDPQRTIFYLPTVCVPYQQNQNPTSDSYGCPQFELWGVPQYVLVYQLYFIRKGTALMNDSDTLPPAVGEDAVMAKARAYAYEWAEAQKGDMPRNAGSDFRFLIAEAKDDFNKLWKQYRLQDRDMIDNWYAVRRLRNWMSTSIDGYYNAIGNTANPGAAW